MQQRNDKQNETKLSHLLPLHAGTEIEDGLFDTTAIWQEKFGLDGKLIIREGRKDTRPPFADGPTEMTFSATPTTPGLYTFVFVRVDGFDKPNQVVAAHLGVWKGVQNSKPPTITPLQPHGRFNYAVAPDEPAYVLWHDYQAITPLGGGWRLSEVVYTESTDYRDKPGIPRYDYIGGE
ncbi:MAG: hypothetical protein ACPGYV_01290 [Phycisphaeraceae bacterium]